MLRKQLKTENGAESDQVVAEEVESSSRLQVGLKAKLMGTC